MPLPDLDIVESNIVLLSASDAMLQVGAQEITTILKDVSVEMAPPPLQQVRFVSIREQVVVQVGGNQFVFNDQSGGEPKARLPEIASGFGSLLQSKGVMFRAYGYNFAVAVDARGGASSGELLLQRFVNQESVEKRTSVALRGAGIRLFYDMAEAKCNLQIEPQEQRVNAATHFARINYHYEITPGEFPQRDTLRSDFAGKWVLFKQTLEQLLG